MTEVLRAEGLVRRYDGRLVLDHVDLSARAGRVTAVIGPNGAGKTTLFQCLSGVGPVDAGQVWLAGHDVTRRSSDERARLGLARTFQHSSLFATMTVADNLRVAAENHTRRGVARGLLGVPDRGSAAIDARISAVAAALGVGRWLEARAGTLPTGTLRLAEMARALCLDPLVLLLDEPASGLDGHETDELHRIIEQLVRDGLAIVVIEHDIDLVLGVADELVALAGGRVVAAGAPAEVARHPAVRELVLGRPA